MGRPDTRATSARRVPGRICRFLKSAASLIFKLHKMNAPVDPKEWTRDCFVAVFCRTNAAEVCVGGVHDGRFRRNTSIENLDGEPLQEGIPCPFRQSLIFSATTKMCPISCRTHSSG